MVHYSGVHVGSICAKLASLDQSGRVFNLISNR
jgi:hypothetical protein